MTHWVADAAGGKTRRRLLGLVALSAIASCGGEDERLRPTGCSPDGTERCVSTIFFVPDAASEPADSFVDAGDTEDATEAADAGDTADGSDADDGSQADATEPPEDAKSDDVEVSDASPPEAGTIAGLRRHVIVIIGDGMQLAHEIATSRYLTGFDDGLVFHAFPVRVFKTTWDVNVYDHHAATLGLPSYSRTSFDPTVGYDPALGGEAPYPVMADDPNRRAYLVGGAVPFSASTATAMSTGFKTDSDNLAWLPGDPPDGALETSAERLRRLYGMSIGYVTTGPLPGATPAAWFAHRPYRFDYWTISREILTQTRPEVVIGGGTGSSGYADPADLAAARNSGEYWTVERSPGVDGSTAVLAGAVMANQQQQKLLGLFGASFACPIPLDSPGAPEFTKSSVEDPTMAAASIAALEVLSRNPNGFFLLLEQADIDLANHSNDFRWMVGCVHDLDRAVEAVTAFIDRPDDAVDWTNTTVIVTADHANSYLRLERPLDRGDLPTQEGGYPDGEVSYGSNSHTNELTTVYARGLGAANLIGYTNVYPGLNILDDTAIYHATLDAARR